MKRLAEALKVRPGEGRIAILLVGLMVFTSAGGSIGGNGIDALFFSRFGVRFLPHMYIALGGISLATALAVTVLLARISRERLFVLLPLALAAALVGERLLVAFGFHWVYPLLWLGMNVKGALQALLTWGLAGMVCDTRQAKRLFPLFGAGNILGAVVGGLVTRPLAQLIHAENLLIVWAVALTIAFGIGGALTGSSLGHRGRAKRKRRSGSFVREMQLGFRAVARSRFLGWISASAVVFAILLYSIAFPFSKAVTARFADADALAGFLGIFQGASTAVAFAVSIFAANRLFARYGIMKMVFAFALIYLVGFGVLTSQASFVAIAGFRFVQMVWQQGIFTSAYQATFNVVAPDRKDQVRAFIDGVPGQAGTVVAGVVLLIGEKTLRPRALFAIGSVAALAGAGVTWKALRAYGSALIEALREGRPQVFFAEEEPFGGFRRDAAAAAAALEGVKSRDLTVRRVSAEILGHLPVPEATVALVGALEDRDIAVRVSALVGLARAGASGALLEVAGRLRDPDPEVRRAAVVAINSLAGYPQGAAAWIRPLLEDPDPGVRARAAVTLLRASSDAGQPSENWDPPASATITQMVQTGNVPERVAAIEALGEWGHPAMIDLVLGGLWGGVPAVRRSAASALAGYDPDAAIALLVLALGDPDLSVRQAAADSLAAIGDQALQPVVEALNDSDLETGALTALEKLSVAAAAKDIQKYARTSAEQSSGYIELWEFSRSMNGDEGAALLGDALRDKSLGYATNALRAVGVLSDPAAMAVTIENLKGRDAALRANAIETLESSGYRDVVLPLIPLWEAPPPRAGPDRWLVRVLRDDDPWLRACAVFAAKGIEDSEVASELARIHDSDPDPEVRQTAIKMLEGGPVDTLATLSLMERIILLRRVPLFGGLSSDDLKQVASISGERTYSDSELIAESGEPGDEMYMIVSGEIGVVIGVGGASEAEVTRCGPGEYVGEMSLITRGPRSASLIARGDVRVLFIDQRHFESLLRERPEVSLTLMRALVETIQQANRFLPSELAAKLETARARRTMVGEHRVVTMLFCEVTGSTAMANELDPEEWAEIMNRAYEILIAPVFAHEGTLARITGDAILAFFGAPIAHEDDPVRGVRSGLEMVQGIKTLQESLRRERGLDFNIRVGINTGLVVVGEVGSDLKLEYTPVTDAVNVAARMGQTAAPGTVQISENTQNLVDALFELEDLGPIEVKGRTEPIRSYRVLGEI